MFKKYKIDFDLDDPNASLAHRDIILKKPFLKRLYNDWYLIFIIKSKEIKNGKYLEIGSGGGFLKDVFPEVITSDILTLPNVDLIFSAEKYYSELVEGQVYTFTGGSVKIANSKYTSVKNDYTIIFDRTSVI